MFLNFRQKIKYLLIKNLIFYINKKIKINNKIYFIHFFCICDLIHNIFLKQKLFRKNQIIVNIHDLNKKFKFNVYFILLQLNIIFCLQNNKFTSIINCVVFLSMTCDYEKLV